MKLVADRHSKMAEEEENDTRLIELLSQLKRGLDTIQRRGARRFIKKREKAVKNKNFSVHYYY